MRELHSVWKGYNIYFNRFTGQFETEKGYSSYVESSVRLASVNGL